MPGAQHTQPSWVDGRRGHGIFTYYLLKEMDRLGRKKTGVSAGALERYLRKKVSHRASLLHNGDRQTPELTGNSRIRLAGF